MVTTRKTRRGSVALFAIVLFLALRPGLAQEPTSRLSEPAVEWKFPPQTEVRELIEYAAEKLDFGVLYDDQIDNVRITIRTSTTVPLSSVLPLLESILRMKDLALVDAEIPGWKRVVRINELVTAAPMVDGSDSSVHRASQPVTEIIRLRGIDASRVVDSLKHFLSLPESSGTLGALRRQDPQLPEPQLMVLSDSNSLVVTDFAENIHRIKTVIKWMEKEDDDKVFEVLSLRHVSAKVVAETVTNMIAGGQKKGNVLAGPAGLRVIPDDLSNQLILVGSRDRVDVFSKIVGELDVEDQSLTKSYSLEHSSVEQARELLQSLLDADNSATLKMLVAPNAAALIVQASPREHDQIASILKQIDVERPKDQSRIGLHHLDHTTAFEVLTTLRSMESSQTGTRQQSFGPAGWSGGYGAGYFSGADNSRMGYSGFQPSSPSGGGATFSGRLRSGYSSGMGR